MKYACKDVGDVGTLYFKDMWFTAHDGLRGLRSGSGSLIRVVLKDGIGVDRKFLHQLFHFERQCARPTDWQQPDETRERITVTGAPPCVIEWRAMRQLSES